MMPYQNRVVTEKTALDEKLANLEIFIQGLTFPTIDSEEQTRLLTQVSCMQGYSNVLAERIAAFPKEKTQ